MLVYKCALVFFAVSLSSIALHAEETAPAEVATTAPTPAPAWKPGDKLTAADLPPYTDLVDPVLSEVGADSITVAHKHGATTFPAHMLPPPARAKFGLDQPQPPLAPVAPKAETGTEEAQASARQRYLQTEELMVRQAERQRLLEKLPKDARSRGAQMFYADLVKSSGALQVPNSDPNGPPRYSAGPLFGKTEDEGIAVFVHRWSLMNESRKADWEREATPQIPPVGDSMKMSLQEERDAAASGQEWQRQQRKMERDRKRMQDRVNRGQSPF